MTTSHVPETQPPENTPFELPPFHTDLDDVRRDELLHRAFRAFAFVLWLTLLLSAVTLEIGHWLGRW